MAERRLDMWCQSDADESSGVSTLNENLVDIIIIMASVIETIHPTTVIIDQPKEGFKTN